MASHQNQLVAPLGRTQHGLQSYERIAQQPHLFAQVANLIIPTPVLWQAFHLIDPCYRTSLTAQNTPR
jgi:hypothetical protein